MVGDTRYGLARVGDGAAARWGSKGGGLTSGAPLLRRQGGSTTPGFRFDGRHRRSRSEDQGGLSGRVLS